MRRVEIGDLVQSNVSGSVGIITEIRPPTAKDWRPKFRVLFADHHTPMWLTSQVLEVICKECE